jgi:EAL domain-containing protein (putative c-di-GMP-specific phosphodiesterase class I)
MFPGLLLGLSPAVLRLRFKLDRDLIGNLDCDQARRSLVTALVLLALDVRATVTGEGVETAAQLETLKTLGVDQAQGYLLARPTTDADTWQEWWTRGHDPSGTGTVAGAVDWSPPARPRN